MIRVTATDDDGGTGFADATIVVEAEDARATYVGLLFVSTDPKDPDNAVVPLRAVIQDISVVDGDPGYDPETGNITMATVTFIDRDSDTIIASDLPVSLIGSEIGTGVATYDWQAPSLNKNETATSYRVGIVVNDCYGRDSTGEDVVVTIARPEGTFITGGGYLMNEASSGAYAGEDGLKTSFGFNVKFNRKLTNLQGHFNGIVRRDDGAGGIQVLQIKSNATQSLVVDPTRGIDGAATFVSKANLTDVTIPDAPVGVAGNLTLIVNMTDNDETGDADTIGFTLWDKGELLFSNNWDGAQTLEQILAGGKLAVHADGHRLVHAAGRPALSTDTQAVLTMEQLQPVVREAISFWAGAVPDLGGTSVLSPTTLRVADLPEATLGFAFADTIWIDQNAAGYGWGAGSSSGVDLLSVVTHEFGHILGLEHDQTYPVMATTLGSGVTTLPVPAPPQSFEVEKLSTLSDVAPDWQWMANQTRFQTHATDLYFEQLAAKDEDDHPHEERRGLKTDGELDIDGYFSAKPRGLADDHDQSEQ